MRILILSPYPPWPTHGGGRLRIYHLIRGLAARHELCCLTFAPNECAEAELAPLREFCRVVTVRGPRPRSLPRRAFTTLASPLPDMALRNAAPAYTAALARLLGEQHFDAVQAESIEMAGHGLFAAARGPLPLLDEFNAEYVLQRRAALGDLARPRSARALAGGLYSLVQWAKLAAYERRLLRGYRAVLAVSDDDRRALLKLRPSARVEVVPNGVETAFFNRSALPEAPACPGGTSLVFTGTLDFRPNVDAITWFVNEVLPLIHRRRPDVRLRLVGRSPAPAVCALHDGKRVELVGEVADVRPTIAGAAVYVVPMRIGGGVRLKLLEALAMEVPTVSTTMGAEGVTGLRDGIQLLLADDPAAFAAAVVRLLDDPALGRSLGAAGRALVTAHYDWNTIVPRLEQIYADLEKLPRQHR